MKRLIILLVVLLATGCVDEPPEDSAPDIINRSVSNEVVSDKGMPQPNILLIMLDDAGYNDVAGFAAGEPPTPRLARLAEQGARFIRHYADSTCRPARVSLLTGQQAARVATMPDFRGISPEVLTLPEQLQAAGYSTHHIGKWHVGDTTPLAWPSAQGFDSWQGFLNQFLLRGPNKQGQLGYRRPTYTDPWLQINDEPPQPFEGHLTDILADLAVEKVQSLADQSQPWFINYWLFAPHNPATVAPRYRDRFPQGKAGQYQALLKHMDDSIGRVLDALQSSGQMENTLVVVVSDNGGTNERADNNRPFVGKKGQYSEGGTRTPLILRWPGQIDPGQDYAGVTAIYDLYPTLLAAAGVPVSEPGAFDGIDLLPLLAGDEVPQRSLYWELGGLFNYYFSVLDANGRWRLDDERLFDLQNDPYARVDVAASQAAIVARLRQQFIDWRWQVHRLAIDAEPLDSIHGWKINGDSFRRSPGYGGLTLAMEVSNPEGGVLSGTLVEQPGIWSMQMLPDQRLRVSINEIEMITGPLELNRACHALVFTSYYFRSKLQSHLDRTVWNLYIDGELVAEKLVEHPENLPDNFLNPTYIGTDSQQRDTFSARILKPHFFNEFFYADDHWEIGRGITDLDPLLCEGS